jgi:hypothetical protein
MENLREFLLQARTIAVLGAHPNPAKAAFYVPDYLARSVMLRDLCKRCGLKAEQPKVSGKMRLAQENVRI